jgi:hypothetical protein
VRYSPHHHARRTDHELLARDIAEGDAADEFFDADREVGRRHEFAERVRDAFVALADADDVEVRAGHVERGEERQPLDMIPMQMGDERRTAKRLGCRPFECFAEITQTGSEIEDDRIAIALQ